MHRLPNRRTVCRPLRRALTPAPATCQSTLSVRARWLNIPVRQPTTVHRCLTTTSAASSASPLSSPSQSFSTTPFLYVGLAVVAATAALYATQPSAASFQQTVPSHKRIVQPTERVALVGQPAQPEQHADSETNTIPSSPPSPLPSSPPAVADSSLLTIQFAAGASESSRASSTDNANANEHNSIATATATDVSPVASVSPASSAPAAGHNHSPSDAATTTSRPPSAAEAAYLARYYSAPVDEHPSVRNLRVLTANRIDEVLANSPPFLLYLFDPTCSACALYTPIVHALAYALDTSDKDDDDDDEKDTAQLKQQPSEGVRVYVMNDATDYKPSFLSPHEENTLPILKFFPQPTARRSPTTASAPTAVPTQYSGSPHLSAMLRYLHEQTGGAFDLERALQRARSRLPTLRAELAERGAQRLQQSEDWALYLHSPCGQRIREYSMAELMGKYVEAEEGESGAEEKYDKFVQCMEEQEEDTMDYFEAMAMIANETVQQLRDKRAKKRRQQQGNASSSAFAEDGDNVSS